MILSDYKNYDELPLFLNAELIAKTLGIAPSSAYELMREKTSRRCMWANALWCPRNNSGCGWKSRREAWNEKELGQAGPHQKLFSAAQ